MLTDQITFWKDENNQYYIPIGGAINKRHNGSILGYGAREIAGWLANDIQYSPNSVDIWINNLTDLASSLSPDGFFGMGNAHWVMVTKNKVFIACEYVQEQRVLLTIDQLLYILEQYKTFLDGNYTDPDFPPEPIDVEYITEGEEAMRIYAALEGSHGLFYLEE